MTGDPEREAFRSACGIRGSRDGEGKLRDPEGYWLRSTELEKALLPVPRGTA